VPAIAKIVGKTVEVYSNKIGEPKYSRYAWRDISNASLFNKEGLPASSFSTE
jgi:sialate O-acetylesterase